MQKGKEKEKEKRKRKRKRIRGSGSGRRLCVDFLRKKQLSVHIERETKEDLLERERERERERSYSTSFHPERNSERSKLSVIPICR